MNIRYRFALLLIAGLSACNTGQTYKALKHKKWRVYDVSVPKNDPYNNTQITQAIDLKNGYYADVYYQFLDDNVFIATINGVPDTGRYNLLSNGKIISITAPDGSRKSEHLINVTKLDDDNFNMKVASGDFHFILHTRKE